MNFSCDTAVYSPWMIWIAVLGVAKVHYPGNLQSSYEIVFKKITRESQNPKNRNENL